MLTLCDNDDDSSGRDVWKDPERSNAPRGPDVFDGGVHFFHRVILPFVE